VLNWYGSIKKAFFKRAFLPLFGVQFLGAFNDNLFKSALVMFITFKATTSHIALLTTLAAGIFILPFFTFSAFAGNITDQFEKTRLVRQIKLAEIGIMLLGGLAFILSSLTGMFIVLFLMGIQSAFFGPLKYAILPELLKEAELTPANAWFSASTFIAILLGTLVGGWVILVSEGNIWLSALVIGCALLGYGFSRLMPLAHPRPYPKKVHFRPLFLTHQEVLAGRQYPQAFLAVIAISWFWFLGAGYLSQIPVMVKINLSGNESVVLLFLTTFSLGIGIGAFLINRLISKFKTLSALSFHALMLVGISILMIISNLYMNQSSHPQTLKNILEYLQDLPSLIVLICLLFIAILGGAYIVPLYTHLQVNAPEYFRGRMIAVNNIVNSLLMVLSSLVFIVGYSIKWDLLTLFYVLAALNLLFAYWVHQRIKILKVSEV